MFVSLSSMYILFLGLHALFIYFLLSNLTNIMPYNSSKSFHSHFHPPPSPQMRLCDFFLVPCKTISVWVVYNKLRYNGWDGWMLYAALSRGGWMDGWMDGLVIAPINRTDWLFLVFGAHTRENRKEKRDHAMQLYSYNHTHRLLSLSLSLFLCMCIFSYICICICIFSCSCSCFWPLGAPCCPKCSNCRRRPYK